ncbi:MAG: succinic semialdehyde dehydrogenase [Actinomycetaceae bacterium]|nr:succinic semialdehyde dehydrogenase [Actinomycetaceae bacterium]MDY5854156.1 succinic semialdehyde dehydrogenase [Arcanobacterium sp.]
MAIDITALDRRGRRALNRLMPMPEQLVSVGGNDSALTQLPKYAALTGTQIGELPGIDVDDVPAVFERAREVGTAWAHTSFAHRKDLMRAFAGLVIQEREALLDLVQWENGKNRASAFEEVYDVVANALFYGQNAKKVLKPRRAGGAVPGLTHTRTYHHPKGVVAVISPWNYPLTLAISDALAAIMAGNAIVMKPDSQTPYTALACKSLLVAAGFPRDLVQVIIGSGAKLGGPMIDEADFVMFTGSSSTGAGIAQQAGANLTALSAELGGKNPLIVRSDAPMPRAVRGAMKACFASSGQLCISIERMYIHTDIWDRFVPEFVRAVNDMRVESSYSWAADMGPLIGESQFEKVSEHVAEAVAKGAVVLAGGKPLPEAGRFGYAPTVLTGVTPEMDIFAHETFGPVVSLYRVGSDAEAIQLANATEYGLNSAIWSSDLKAARRMAVQLKTGAVNINDGYAAAWGSMKAPSGGMGISGIGRRHGLEGILKYTDPQAVATQRIMHIAAPGKVGPFVIDEEKWAAALSVYMKLLRHIS